MRVLRHTPSHHRRSTGAWVRKKHGDWRLLSPLPAKEGAFGTLDISCTWTRVPGSLWKRRLFIGLALSPSRSRARRGPCQELIEELVSLRQTSTSRCWREEGREVRNSGVNKGAAAVGCVASVEPPTSSSRWATIRRSAGPVSRATQGARAPYASASPTPCNLSLEQIT